MKNINNHDTVFKKGIFAKKFPIKDGYEKITETSIADSQDIIQVSNNFKCEFYNSGVMQNGEIYTVKTTPDCNLIYPLKNIREKDNIEEKFI